MSIHSTAIIESGAEIGSNVSIGAYSVIGPKVKIGNGTIVKSHVVLEGRVSIGEQNVIYSHSCIGGAPQDFSYNNEDTEVIIGGKNIFREFVTINRGTLKENGKTIVGNENMIMTYTHLGHDVKVGDKTRIVNACNIAGHVSIGDNAIISGGSIIGQFIRIGQGVFIGGGTIIDREVPPYCAAYGNRVRLKGINIIGLKRLGVEKSKISELVDFFRMMEASHLGAKAFIDSKVCDSKNTILENFRNFVQTSKIGIPNFMS